MCMFYTLAIVSRVRKVIAWCNFLIRGFHLSQFRQMVSRARPDAVGSLELSTPKFTSSPISTYDFY